MTQIQNRKCCIFIIPYMLVLFLNIAGLGEFRIRDLNDEINKLIREKRHWEERILELGGPDYNVSITQCILSFQNYYLKFVSEI